MRGGRGKDEEELEEKIAKQMKRRWRRRLGGGKRRWRRRLGGGKRR